MNVDTGQFQAITASVAELRNDVAALSERLMQATEAEAVIRRASYPESMLYGRQRPRHARGRGHLKVVR